jgi:endonuclease-3
MFRLIRRAIAPFPKATLFELRDRGYDSPFEQLLACVLSIRTLDEVSLVAAERVFQRARTPGEIAKLSEEELAGLIQPCTFAFQKAKNLRRLSEMAMRDYGGKLPCDFAALTALPGIGPKCANLVLGIACDQPKIGVDIHVHRITNRWGYVSAPTPEKTLAALERKLPRSRWVEINELLVPFGKHVCLGRVPKCSECPVFSYCRRVGVTRSR